MFHERRAYARRRFAVCVWSDSDIVAVSFPRNPIRSSCSSSARRTCARACSAARAAADRAGCIIWAARVVSCRRHHQSGPPARAPSPSSELHRACPFAVPARRFPGGHLSSQPVLFRRDPKNPRRRQSFMLYRKHFTYGIGLCGWQVSSKQLVVAVLAANRPSRESICLGLPADWNARANGQAAGRRAASPSRASPHSGHHPLPSPAAFDSNVDRLVAPSQGRGL